MAAKQNFEIWAGNSLDPLLVELDPSVDLTGTSVVRWWVGVNSKSVGADVKIKKSSHPTEGVSLSQDMEGVWSVRIDLLPDDTEDLGGSTLYHELEHVTGSGNVTTIWTGKLKVNPVLIPSDLDI